MLANHAVRYDGPIIVDSITHKIKYNEVNGENNCDGINDNYLANPGYEGFSGD